MPEMSMGEEDAREKGAALREKSVEIIELGRKIRRGFKQPAPTRVRVENGETRRPSTEPGILPRSLAAGTQTSGMRKAGILCGPKNPENQSARVVCSQKITSFVNCHPIAKWVASRLPTTRPSIPAPGRRPIADRFPHRPVPETFPHRFGLRGPSRVGYTFDFASTHPSAQETRAC